MTRKSQIAVVSLALGVSAALVVLLVQTHPKDQSAERVSAPEPQQALPEAKEGAFLATAAPSSGRRASGTPSDKGKKAAAQGSISGWVVTSSGEYVAGAQVGASSEEGSAFVSTTPDGRFELASLPATVMNVFATAAGFAPDHAYDISVGTTDLMLIVDEPARVLGTVKAEGYPHLFVRLCERSKQFQKEVCIKSEYSSPPAPQFEMTRLPAGTYELVFVSEDRELRRHKLELKAGEQVTLEPVTL